ncbi:hypothetical protein EHS13_30635 [Paenibacillus psychroresistens]|uniref:DUF4177 domain-containing protein n=1 Tax=Paenibacillus psychroresistens TaxID=1778678 RepID=A0A6B8RTN0_9BACL|nr:hypothetical protein [Paenibacillus psychroresistens]QGQ98925.1 hypothetical protein EHS13_30635 [Paenibacillus psychroresistens]
MESNNSRYSDLLVEVQKQKWEYATEVGLSDYTQIYHGRKVPNYDYALALWGRNGWELISIIPQNDRLIAFFKRPTA